MEAGEEGDAAENDPGAEGARGDTNAGLGGGGVTSGNAMDSLVSSKFIALAHFYALPEFRRTYRTNLDDDVKIFAYHCRQWEPGDWKAKILHLYEYNGFVNFMNEKVNFRRLEDSGLKHAVQLFEGGYFKDLRELKLCIDHTRVSENSVERFMNSLSNFKDLRVLHVYLRRERDLSDWRDDPETFEEAMAMLAMFWRAFAGGMPSITSLEELVVHQYPRGYLPATQFPAVLWHLPNLRVLNLRGLGVGCDLARCLSQAFRCDSGQDSPIESIDLSQNDMAEEGGKYLAQALNPVHVGGLIELNLSYNGMGDGIAEALATSLQSGKVGHLKYLGLAGNRLGKSSAAHLAKAFDSGALGSLRVLDLANNILDEGVFVSMAKSFQSDQASELKELQLGGICIGNKGIMGLAEAMKRGKLSNLYSLQVSGGMIGIEGVAALVEAFNSGYCTGMETIDLCGGVDVEHSHCEFQGVVAAIGGLLEDNKLPSLTLMWLPTSKLSSTATKALEKAYRQNPNLAAKVLRAGKSNSSTALSQSHLGVATNLQEPNKNRLRNLEMLVGKEDVQGMHSRLLFCGNSQVGKTTFRKTFCGTLWDKSLPDQEPTKGIEVTHFRIPRGQTISLWDLAGQRDFEVLYSAFLSDFSFAGGQATFFVIVCDARDFGKAKQELEYWMRFISSNSAKDLQAKKQRVFVMLNCFHGHTIPKDELQRWNAFLKQCSGKKGFMGYLHVHEKPFIADVKDTMALRKFKCKLFKEARGVLQMPPICSSIQDRRRTWVIRRENRNYPVLPWEEFERLFGVHGLIKREKLEAATEYLHESGQLILFKQATSSLTSSENEGEGFTSEGGLVILNPDWFCNHVIGNLFLPADTWDQHADVLDFESKREGVVRVETLAKKEFKIPSDKFDEMVMLLRRLGICYQLPGRLDIMFVPALMKEWDIPGWSELSWNGVVARGAWVTGFSLKINNPEVVLLPVNVLAQLQVNITLDKWIGQMVDCDFQARRNSVSFKFKSMYVLIEYSAQMQEQIDVLVKPFVVGVSKSQQINVAQEFVNRITMIAKECARGVEFDKRIIRPWSVGAGWVPMQNRDVKMQVRSLIKEIEKRGQLQMLALDVDGELVGENDVLSDDDLSGFREQKRAKRRQ